MPQNKNLKPIDLPMVLKFNQEPKTEFYNNLAHLKVELVDMTITYLILLEVLQNY